MSEPQEQIAVIEYCDYKGIPIFHIPNGGKRNPREAANLKRQGVRPGVPDLFVPVPMGERHGLFIEMKYGKNKATKAQVEWIKTLRLNGYGAYICYGAKNAIACIEEYLRPVTHD